MTLTDVQWLVLQVCIGLCDMPVLCILWHSVEIGIDLAWFILQVCTDLAGYLWLFHLAIYIRFGKYWHGAAVTNCTTLFGPGGLKVQQCQPISIGGHRS